MEQLCTPEGKVRLLVEALAGHAKKAGLTEERVRDAAEIRLRAGRIYSPGYFGPSLYVQITTLPPERDHYPAYGIQLSFMRGVETPAGFFTRAATWNTGSIGQGGADYIIGALNANLDRFVSAFLRAHDHPACQAALGSGTRDDTPREDEADGP